MGSQITRILVANRGEIAVRVIRACRELGIGCVAAHQPGERAALHVELADRAAEVESFLDARALVAAAVDAGADALHPGYGYLAEDPVLAEAVERAGLRWIGPPAAAMRLLADKVAARRLAEACGLPVTPGYAGVDLTDAALIREAAAVGYPLLVKAAGGGGGRGMREVESAAGLEQALAAARREARAAFGSDALYLERLMDGARHVEVQVLADHHGRVVHLGERDCSLQRRHQKLLEESPSPAVDPELRSRLGEAAVALARAAGYAGAGTVEFLLDGGGGCWFLEMNARLQVEHPVTEAVTGIDLVRAQIAVAAGEPLQLEQAELTVRGHAIEVRLCAEDPAAGFLPTGGRLQRLRMPAWPGLRVDAGVREGDTVGLAHDPLLVKLIAHAE
ncbi:MAG TPA: biotin carboxylase N-terminal domain-containing protein, partial [Gaiellales bacterium]|nr:biotin carboxylase N-terminal domain-containing protein [Gaiellales bacterium]